jgi:glycosyltransferase involved in cell wall biosynthesis
MSRVLAITGRVPFSTTEEAFVQDELETMIRQGADLVIAPARIAERVPNPASVASGLSERVVAEPVVSRTVLRGALRTLGRHPVRSARAVLNILSGAGSLRNLATNLAMAPKALWLADVAVGRGITHVHGYWLAHPASMAMVVGQVTGLPWSATGFRWDIDADNAMSAKIASARFLRVADELGQSQMSAKVARSTRPSCPIPLIRTGVAVPPRDQWAGRPLAVNSICCPGAFVEKKGHLVLLEAVAERVRSGQNCTVHLFGDGPMRGRITSAVRDLGLQDRVFLHGIVALDRLREFLRTERPVVVLPSIKADDGQEEGIPVVLIEAMANGAPVISTRTGSIPTLVIPGCGWLVPDRDPAALAAAMAEVAGDPEWTDQVCLAAADRVSAEFDREVTAASMLKLLGAAPAEAAT